MGFLFQFECDCEEAEEIGERIRDLHRNASRLPRMYSLSNQLVIRMVRFTSEAEVSFPVAGR